MILSVCLMASLAVVACKPDGGDNKKDNGNEQKPDDGKKPDEEEFKMEVAIDGNFAEWDALTEDTADGAEYIYEENACDTLGGILRLKLTSDEDYIYVYTELNYENIFQAEGGPFTQGGSWTGFLGNPHPGTPGALIVYVGGDGDDTGAFAARSIADQESMWSYTGFDAFPQYYFCFDVAAGKMQFGWNQNNWPQNHGYTEDKWGLPLGAHGDGWWGDDVEGTPVSDNTVSDQNTFKFSDPMKIVDPVSKKEVMAVKIEFSMDRGVILESQNKIVDKAVIGIFYEQRGTAAAQTHAVGAGKLPSGNDAVTLKLK